MVNIDLSCKNADDGTQVESIATSMKIRWSFHFRLEVNATSLSHCKNTY